MWRSADIIIIDAVDCQGWLLRDITKMVSDSDLTYAATVAYNDVRIDTFTSTSHGLDTVRGWLDGHTNYISNATKIRVATHLHDSYTRVTIHPDRSDIP